MAIGSLWAGEKVTPFLSDWIWVTVRLAGMAMIISVLAARWNDKG